MATVTIHQTQERIEKEAAGDYLNAQGLIYQSWETDRLTGRLKTGYDLTPAEQKELLGLYAREISDLKTAQGYVTEDVIVLAPDTPNLDAILAKFRPEHHHTDDEVRFVVDGGGIFTIRKPDVTFDVTVGPGDLFVVPAYTRHWFNLTDAARIKCIRIFRDPAGWVAIYQEAPRHTTSSF